MAFIVVFSGLLAWLRSPPVNSIYKASQEKKVSSAYAATFLPLTLI